MSDEYPTEEQLQAVLDFKGSPRQFIAYINSIWWSEGFTIKAGRDSFKKSVKRCTLSTWGWSGNEDIIENMKQTWFWMLWWRQSSRGGHYEFEVPTDGFLKSLTSASGLETFGLPYRKPEADVTRFEVIDHRQCVSCRGRKTANYLQKDGSYKELPCEICDGSGINGGRVFTAHSNPERSIIEVELSYQDEGKTLKVFVKDKQS